MLDEQLIKAAGTRALRTLIQGIIAGGLVNLAIAWVLDGADPRALIVAGTTVLAAAITSFLQGIWRGLPEVAQAIVPETSLEALIALGAAKGINMSKATTDLEALAIINAERERIYGDLE